MYDNSIQGHETLFAYHVPYLRPAPRRGCVRQQLDQLHPPQLISTMNIHPLRPHDHEDAARVAISWLAERHRKGWRSAFEALLDRWRPEGPRDGWHLDEDGMTMVSINAGEWLISCGEIHARGGLREINAYLLGREGPFLTPGQRDWIA